MKTNANQSVAQAPVTTSEPFSLAERWEAVREPGSEVTTQIFADFTRRQNGRRTVLNCAIPPARAKYLTDFEFPSETTVHDCLVASGTGRFPPALKEWKYKSQIQPATQLLHMRTLPTQPASLQNLPWFDSPSQATGIGINGRHLRYHHSLWHELKPKTIRGLHTTLVFVTPQIGFSLTPHIKLDQAFHYIAALARAYTPAQLFPARYLFPDANLGNLAGLPAPIFSDLLPETGGLAFPVMDCTPDQRGTLCRYDGSDRCYGYPFSLDLDPQTDATLPDHESGCMRLPNGRTVCARNSESHIYALLDAKLRQELKWDRDEFAARTCLTRGTVTHDGLPFQLPVEMQSMVFAVILTHWEMELDKPGELESYTLKTRHAAIRGFNYYQRVEPFHANFMRLINEVAKDPEFCTYPLATHLTHPWLGGNFCKSDQLSESEKRLGPGLMQAYYQQQLNWTCGVFNLWNHVSFRKGVNLEKTLSMAGLAFHQMRPLLKFDSHLFPRPVKRASFWPDTHANWSQLDQTGQMPCVW
jgi:hypothetical protein